MSLRRLALLSLVPTCSALAAPGYYRDPAVHGDTVVFTAEGDLWRVPLAGGSAERLTTHPADESQAAISPDGRRIAFVASYDGPSEVYVMPLAGGEPRRLTFEGGRVWVQGFTPRGEVVYASENLVGPSWSRVLRVVDADTGASRELPLADANETAFAADGRTLWFTRFGLHVTGDNARDYRGGAAAELWRWSGNPAEEAVRWTPSKPGNVRQPMAWKDRVVAIADFDGAANLWSFAADGSDARALTQHRDFEVRRARLDAGRVVYALGADLRVLDLASGSDRPLAIEFRSDGLQKRERLLAKPLDYLTRARVNADGTRVALTARGRVALAGTGPLRRVEIAADPRARLREAALSKDGRWVYAFADLDGRSEIWRYPADGSPAGQKLVGDERIHRWHLYPSPDGRWLAFDDQQGRLSLLDLARGGTRRIDQAEHGDDAYETVAWSPDGTSLAVVRSDSTRSMPQLVLVDARSGRRQRLTSDRYESHAPVFSRDGRWLYFLSDRSFQSSVPAPWGDRNTGAFFDKRTKVYAYALQPGTRFPFQPRNELTLDDGKKAVPSEEPATTDAARSSGGKSRNPLDLAKKPPPAVSWDGLDQRLYEVPLAAGNYSALAADERRLYLLERAAGSDSGSLKTLAFEADAKPETFMEGLRGFELSADGKTVFVTKIGSAPAGGGAPGVGAMLLLPAGAKAPEKTDTLALRVDDWRLPLNPALEWQQLFDDAWRLHRDFSFDPAMRGVDWDAVRARYAPLLARVGDRADLDDVMAQMAAEVGLLHSQVRGGDHRADPDAPVPAALGAVFEPVADGLRIAHIYRTDPELPSDRAPLQQPGVDARTGDVLVAVNGAPVKTAADLAAALRQQVGQQVLLDLRRAGHALRTVVQPIALTREAELRYGDWVVGNREKVAKAGSGRFGYLHLRAMGTGDMANFVREFYANFDREGLVIDVRRNRGGNIDSWVIEKLLRRAWAFWAPPRRAIYWNMQQSFRGRIVVLADALTYSDGETFAAGVKALGLGPVIGRRTAGAGIWLSDRNRLADNGLMRIAEMGQFDAQGRWLIEGRGVSPDVEVDNLPLATARGGDAQLDAAIADLERQLRATPVPPFKPQPIPPRGTPGHDGSR